MIVQFVQFESTLSLEEAMDVAQSRAPEFRKVPGLVQKHYLKLGKPNHFGGFYIWESKEAMMAFRETELAKTIPAAYRVVSAPDVEIHEHLFSLREMEMAT